ncbi:CerR family C-terminal domain-containing protein [Sphingomonas canadensis]|uniref:CerR family C-terminal domain-containing protein n=1 Tax=Sphingomonas canadensis TaxID=1219257 RepID=A0ABW3H6S3_9SPHN|nr:TetR/AcrR family transcriptional regulator [Sphingomonas canadensis]MCW3836207.1 CerR family C-terminal domain-containing protein [Sphingomonas canadensis]
MNVLKKRRGTRERLLDAACDIFVEKGFDDATVAEICARAEANVAALNYHFGNKAAAYRAAYLRAFEESAVQFPFEADAAPAPEDRLAAHVRSILKRMNHDGGASRFDKMRNWEDIRPTGIVDDVDEEVLAAARAHMLDCLTAIIGAEVTREQLLLCEASVLGMARMVLPFNRRHIALLANRRIDDAMIDTLTGHIVAVALGGLRHAIALGQR